MHQRFLKVDYCFAYYSIRLICSDQGLYKEARCYREVPELDQADACSILDKWLKLSHRTLTPVQRDIILTAIQACPLPLFLKLSFDDALRWHSYDPVSVTQLKDTVTDTIHNLMWRIERRHGKIMVGHALGYITAGKCLDMLSYQTNTATCLKLYLQYKNL